jgi:hypothetical protein
MISLVVVILVSCATEAPPPTPYDPTGVWAMTVTWGAGTCQIQAPSDLLTVVVAEARGDYIAETPNDPSLDVTGGVLVETAQATLDITITDDDAFDDGGSTVAQLALLVGAGLDEQIRGTARFELAGAQRCTHDAAIAGRLR